MKTIRAGNTTVAVSNSPLILDHTDEVALIVEGKLVAIGNHFELLKSNDVYRSLVVRGE